MIHGRNILTISAHPDDVEFGAMGTLLKYRDSMNKLFCYVATLGGEGDSSNGLASRKAECEKAMQKLHPDHIFCQDRIGLKAEDYHLEVGRIEGIVKGCGITLVLVNSRHDTHQDHRLISEITLTALRRAKIGILLYASPSVSLEFRPRVFVDIGHFVDEKMAALKFHQTQGQKPYMNQEYLDAFHSDPYALLRGIKYVERFEIETICL